jgi:hypothetical protein
MIDLGPRIVGDAFKLTSLVYVYHLTARNRACVQAAMELLQAGAIAGIDAILESERARSHAR